MNLALFHGSETAALGFQEGGKVPHAPFCASQSRPQVLTMSFLGQLHGPRDAARHTYPGNRTPKLRRDRTPRRSAVHGRRGRRVVRERFTVSTSQVTSIDIGSLSGVAGPPGSPDRVGEAVATLSGIVRVALRRGRGPGCLSSSTSACSPVSARI